MKNSYKIKNLGIIDQKISVKNLVPEYIHFDVDFCHLNFDTLYDQVKKKFKKNIIIRSASYKEDSEKKSYAGMYDSAIVTKITRKIFNSNLKKVLKKLNNKKDRILIQTYIDNPEISGVLFNTDLKNNSDYYVINYDKSGKTNKITSGIKNKTAKVLYIYKNSKFIESNFIKLIKIVKKIEKIFTNCLLDFEFCIKDNHVYIFQCRKLALPEKIILKKNINHSLNLIEKKIKLNVDSKRILSNMTDWNPIEMLGENPSILANSLYSELITDKIWTESRYSYGYKKISQKKLMKNFLGFPYIDIRTSLESFLPDGLGKKIENKILDTYINKIKKDKFLHDKIEFEVIDTFYSIDKSKYLKIFLNKNDIDIYQDRLRVLTNNIFTSKQLKKDILKSNEIKNKLKQIKIDDQNDLSKIILLMNLCKDYGTRPFSGAARCAFIATSLLKIFHDKKFISQEDINLFYKNLELVTKKINHMAIKAKKNKKNKDLFIKFFGHLRPSAYEINSLNYSENFNKYFASSINKKNNFENKKFFLSKQKKNVINNFFKKNKLEINCDNFFKFASTSIISREKIKCDFSEIINQIFIYLINFGKKNKISRQDMENISIKTVIKSQKNENVNKVKLSFKSDIIKHKKQRSINSFINLPDVISSSRDIYNFEINVSKGNFINKGSVITKTVIYKKGLDLNSLNDKIVLVENADPGYDFLFTYNIKGLITKYGGPNSHMAIRCLEENILACIGYGSLFNEINDNQNLKLDCDNKKIHI